jgi:colanic acid/amylovoran biosynthesis glycosyltransferase
LAVPLQLFPSSKLTGNDNLQIRLLSVGRLVEKKGFEYAIMAAARVIQQFPHIQYEIAGDGPLKSSLKRIIAELGIAKNVRLVGWRDREEILHLLRTAHIFIAPSVTTEDGDQEGIPMVLHEAMASRLPVVSTRHTGIPELVYDGETGFLVPERDPEAIADKVSYLLKNPDRRHKMGERGRAQIEQYHDFDRQTDRLIEIYRSLLEGRSLSPEVQQHVFDSRIS